MAARRILPLLDRVLVSRAPQQTRTSGGVILPETQKKLNEGTVMAVGPGALDKNGSRIAPSVKEGDVVLLPEYGGQTVKLDGNDKHELTLIRETEILAILKQ